MLQGEDMSVVEQIEAGRGRDGGTELGLAFLCEGSVFFLSFELRLGIRLGQDGQHQTRAQGLLF